MTSLRAIRPILFNTLLVPPALSGLKTQTRRTKGLDPVNKNPDKFILSELKNNGYYDCFTFYNKISGAEFWVKCPFGEPGDILWVRETFAPQLKNFTDSKHVTGGFIHKTDSEGKLWDDAHFYKWKPSIHMPKKACRLFLLIKSVRIERLQDISESDAISEGVGKYGTSDNFVYRDYLDSNCSYGQAKNSFMSLWYFIDGVESWNQNPWVWVIEFERIDKPENF